MSHLSPEERVEFDAQLDKLRLEGKPGYIRVSANKAWSVIWNRSTVTLTPLEEQAISELPAYKPTLGL